MSQINNLEAEAAADRQKVERSLQRLKFINRLRGFGLPAIAAAALAGAALAVPIVFPVVAGAVAAIIIGGEFVARRERARLDARLRDLENRHAFDHEEAKRISFAANSFTVAGSSN
jgi:hypothetical protein